MLAITRDSPTRFAPSPSSFVSRKEFWPRYLDVLQRARKTRGFAIPTKEPFIMRSDAEERCWPRLTAVRQAHDRSGHHSGRASQATSERKPDSYALRAEAGRSSGPADDPT
jgi:hypothetical protein